MISQEIKPRQAMLPFSVFHFARGAILMFLVFVVQKYSRNGFLIADSYISFRVSAFCAGLSFISYYAS